jgi:hypothetical protein
MNAWDTNSKVRMGQKRRVPFDPSNQNHLDELKYFKTFNKWRDCCPFELEYPYLDITTMVSDKFLINSLSKIKNKK